MGWYYTQHPGTKANYIAELLEPRTNSLTGAVMRPIRHCWRGGRFRGVLWSIWECTALEPHRARWIQCDILQCVGGCWGHKPIEEAMHPFYFSCPLGYLDLAPVACEEWRAVVREHHVLARRKADRNRLLAAARRSNANITIIE